MKIFIKYFLDECLCYPAEKTYKYFCKSNRKFYYDIQEIKNQPQKLKAKYILPLIRINIIELMEKYLKSLNITKEEVIMSAKVQEPDNINWNQDSDTVFDIAFRIFIDGRYYLKDNNEIDMVSDWVNYRNSICLPIIKKWCAENSIKWYDSNFIHLFHRWRHPFVYKPGKNEVFEVIEYPGCYDFVSIET